MLTAERSVAKSVGSGLRCFRCNRFIPQEKVGGSHLLCSCGGPLLQEYDFERLSIADRDAMSTRPWEMWRYRELLPVVDSKAVYSLAEGGTPLIRTASMARAIGVRNLAIKEEARNPTGTFKARGASVAVSRLKELGLDLLAMPTVGSGGSAWSAYAARAGVKILVGFPSQRDLPAIGPLEAATYGASVLQFPGHLSEAFAAFRLYAVERGASVVGAFLEPYRLEGEKTIGYELAEQYSWRPPDWIVWPTGGAVGLVGLAKAFRELELLHWLLGPLPGLIAVQIEGCAPVVDEISQPAGNSDRPGITRTESIAPGITVPVNAFMDLVHGMTRGYRMLSAAVSEESILAAIKETAELEGLLLSPEGAAAMAAVRSLRSLGTIAEDASVTIVNTATGLRYPHVLQMVLNSQTGFTVAPTDGVEVKAAGTRLEEGDVKEEK